MRLPLIALSLSPLRARHEKIGSIEGSGVRQYLVMPRRAVHRAPGRGRRGVGFGGARPAPEGRRESQCS